MTGTLRVNTGVSSNLIKISVCIADLLNVKDRNVENLSGGELQRFACAMVCIQNANM